MMTEQMKHSRRKSDFLFGTWNVRSLYRSSTLKEVLSEMKKYRIKILAAQETRWKGSGIFDTRTHTILHSDKDDNRHELGVAFIMEKDYMEKILDFKPVNERMCLLRLKTKFFNVTIINFHAQTEEKDDVTKESLYQELERIFDTIPSNDIKIVMRDFNAKIGRESIYKDAIGKHNLHLESNDNGTRVIDFAMARDMMVAST